GEEISSIVDINGLVEYSKGLPGVVYAAQVPFLCQKDTLDKVVGEIKKSKANRLIFAACPSAICGGLISEAMKEAGLGQAFMQFVNLREGVAWVHKDQPEAATGKAKSLVAMAAERARLQKGLAGSSSVVQGGAIVIGGGLSGMVSALSIAEQGYEVHLVEKTSELGGNLRHIHSTLKGDDPQKLLEDTVQAVEASSLISVYRETEIKEISGYAGNFVVTLINSDEETPLEAGAIIIATGGSEYSPGEYSYGQSDSVITQSELEQKLVAGEINPENLGVVVMVQCVGSRNEARPYCSRICCGQALKNALEIKKRNPEAQVFVLYRDMMSYGFMEEFYTLAREAGVIFVRYDEDKEPEVKLEGEMLRVEFDEPTLRDRILLEADLVVLSPAVVPQESNSNLAKMLGLELTENGFFKEAEVKFRPVDFNKEGIYACGLALSPRHIGESIAEAQAAAQRAVTLLSRGYLQPSAVVAEVNERWCTGCEVCIPACPYGARIKDSGRGVVVVREALCHGCGACTAACPSGAAKLRRFTDKQIFSMIDAGV
ncbi:CoB--CoM heterodisulfide reductase iron-sulfur subunit A family protein, partial [Chloroflexota bacterium]